MLALRPSSLHNRDWTPRTKLQRQVCDTLAAATYAQKLERRLPILDAHGITLPRSDATADGSHFWSFLPPL